MSGLVVEAGIYFLLLFTPFAFGGVEMWAKGVIQIVSGLVIAAWALEPPARRLGTGRVRHPRGRVLMWAVMAGFIALVVFQLVPLPASWIATLSPGTHALYAQTLPGYAQGRPFDPDALPGWLLDQFGDRIPASPQAMAEARTLTPPVDDMFFSGTGSALRPLSVNPFETRQRLTLLLCYFGLFAVAASYYRSRERLARLLGVAVFSAFAVSMFGIVQKITWNGKLYWVRESDFFTPFGPFVNKNTYAAFAGTLLPIAVCLGLAGLAQAGMGRRDGLPRMFLWGFAAMTICGGVAFSLSRAGMLAVCLSMLIIGVFVSLYMGRRRDLVVILLAGAGQRPVPRLARPGTGARACGHAVEGQNVPTLMSRFHAWGRALTMIADRPLLGSGLGTFRFAFVNYAPSGRRGGRTSTTSTSSWSAKPVQSAVPYSCWASERSPSWSRGRDSCSGSTERYVWIGIVAGMIALLCHSAVSSTFRFPQTGSAYRPPGALLAMTGEEPLMRRRLFAAAVVLLLVMNSMSGVSKRSWAFVDRYRAERQLGSAQGPMKRSPA